MKLVKFKKNGELVLPEELSRKFSKDDKFIGVADKDTLILHKIQTRLSNIAIAPTKSNDFITPEEIDKEIRLYREEKKKL